MEMRKIGKLGNDSKRAAQKAHFAHTKRLFPFTLPFIWNIVRFLGGVFVLLCHRAFSVSHAPKTRPPLLYHKILLRAIHNGKKSHIF